MTPGSASSIQPKRQRAVLGALPLLALPLALALAASLAHAQFKVVGPDGKVTYTDRPPAAAAGTATALGARSAPAPAAVPLPQALRAVVARYPVTLYTNPSGCDPCDSGRQMLRQRGIPFTEKQIVTAEDSTALERLTGARDAPTLTLGAQTLRGWSSELWGSYLDAAGYPKESALPGNYQNPEPTPLTERLEATARPPIPAVRPAPRAEAARPAPTPAPVPGNIKF